MSGLLAFIGSIKNGKVGSWDVVERGHLEDLAKMSELY
jgi:hypothetical protein